MEEYSGYVGLDVHKETISPAVAYPGRSKPESLGVIANTKKWSIASRERAKCLDSVTRRDRVDTKFTVGLKRRVTIV